MSKAFNDWWNGNELSKDNLHAEDTPAYWAWEGWLAGVKAEREACSHMAAIALLGANRDLADRVIQAIRTRSNT